jgi:hypothetical protein
MQRSLVSKQLEYADAQTQAAAELKASQDKGFALDAYDKARSRINQIDQLMNQKLFFWNLF